MNVGDRVKVVRIDPPEEDAVETLVGKTGVISRIDENTGNDILPPILVTLDIDKKGKGCDYAFKEHELEVVGNA